MRNVFLVLHHRTNVYFLEKKLNIKTTEVTFIKLLSKLGLIDELLERIEMLILDLDQ